MRSRHSGSTFPTRSWTICASGAQGGDWGARVTTALGQRHPEHLIGIHLNMVAFPVPGTADDLTEREQAALPR